MADSLDEVIPVSTHASAREATLYEKTMVPEVEVSTHASAREATSSPGPSGSGRFSFYPRLREGGDLWVYTGALSTSSFYPRLREGGD